MGALCIGREQHYTSLGVTMQENDRASEMQEIAERQGRLERASIREQEILVRDKELFHQMTETYQRYVSFQLSQRICLRQERIERARLQFDSLCRLYELIEDLTISLNHVRLLRFYAEAFDALKRQIESYDVIELHRRCSRAVAHTDRMMAIIAEPLFAGNERYYSLRAVVRLAPETRRSSAAILARMTADRSDLMATMNVIHQTAPTDESVHAYRCGGLLLEELSSDFDPENTLALMNRTALVAELPPAPEM